MSEVTMTDIETVRIALKLMSDDPRVPALEALDRIERVVEAARDLRGWAGCMDAFSFASVLMHDPSDNGGYEKHRASCGECQAIARFDAALGALR